MNGRGDVAGSLETGRGDYAGALVQFTDAAPSLRFGPSAIDPTVVGSTWTTAESINDDRVIVGSTPSRTGPFTGPSETLPPVYAWRGTIWSDACFGPCCK